jgi:hypothetical protein
MSDNVFLTRSELARVRGLDPRNKQFERLAPDGFLLMGSKKIPLFRGGPFVIARLSPAGGTAILKMPLPQPEPSTQTETGKS